MAEGVHFGDRTKPVQLATLGLTTRGHVSLQIWDAVQVVLVDECRWKAGQKSE